MILYLYLLCRSYDEKKRHEIQEFNYFFSSLMWGLGRHWGEISSSSWGKETIEKRVTPPRQGSLGTRSQASLEEMIKTQGHTQGPAQGNTQGHAQGHTQGAGTNERKGGKPQAQENKLS